MSKKDRLKKQSLKQLNEKKAAAAQEEKERLEAGESRSAKKLRKSAKKHSGALMLILKLLMCIPFIWSGICYNVIFMVGISMGEVVGVPRRMAVYLGLGALICLAGIVFAFLSKYVIQFALIFTGSMIYMHAARFIVGKAQTLITESHGLTETQLGVTSKWRLGLYPILIMTLLSAVMLAIFLIGRHTSKKRRQKELDNAPVKSIIE